MIFYTHFIYNLLGHILTRDTATKFPNYQYTCVCDTVIIKFSMNLRIFVQSHPVNFFEFLS